MELNTIEDIYDAFCVGTMPTGLFLLYACNQVRINTGKGISSSFVTASIVSIILFILYTRNTIVYGGSIDRIATNVVLAVFYSVLIIYWITIIRKLFIKLVK